MMAATLPVSTATILNFGSWPTLGQCRQSHIRVGHAENMMVEVGIAAPSLAVEKIFLLPVFVVAILNSDNQPTSGNVGSV